MIRFCQSLRWFFQNKKGKLSEDQQIFLSLIKPTNLQMDKMTKALVILAEEEYDEDEQSRFLNERKNYGQLEHRKKFIEKRRQMFATKSAANIQKQPLKGQQNLPKNRKSSTQLRGNQFKADKKSDLTQKQLEQVKTEKRQQMTKSRIQTSLNRVKKIRSVDLKKISPYLSRNQRIAKAQKVIELQHKFRVAQNQYVEEIKQKKQKLSKPQVKKREMKKQWDASQQEIINNKIFNRYIEQNLKMLQQANKKAYVYKNKVSPKKQQGVSQNMNYNKLSFRDRKEAEYQRNLQQYQRDDRAHSHRQSRTNQFGRSQTNINHSNLNVIRNVDNKVANINKSKGTKPIIEISDKGVRHNQSIVDYELSGKKGKNVGKILESAQKKEQMRMIQEKLNPTINKSRVEKKKQQDQEYDKQVNQNEGESRAINNLYESEQRPEIVIMRQEPQKIQEIKQYLYVKIKQELMEQMKKDAQNKQHQLNQMIEEEKRRKLEQIIEERKKQEQRMKQQEQRMRIQQLQSQRKKIDFDIRIQSIQYSQENVSQFFDKIFENQPMTYHRLYLHEKVEEKKEFLLDQFYIMFLRGFIQGKQVGYAIVRYDWEYQKSRKLVIQYATVKQFQHFISFFHNLTEYMWKNDPVEYIEITVLDNKENLEGGKIVEDLQQYADRRGKTFQKPLYSNITELRYIYGRPHEYVDIDFEFNNFDFSKRIILKCQLLASAFSLNERVKPKIDMNLQVFTNYVFLLQELFRKYLTPQEVVQLRQSSTNIRRLKDIFRVVLQLQKTNPVVDQLTVVEGLNLDDLYEKMRDKMQPPYDSYYWHHFYDKTLQNRLLLAILQFKVQLQFPINSCHLDDRRFMRVNPRRKVLVLKSSVYARDNIYIINTSNKKIRMFIMDAQNYKLMRMELFVFLNLVFNNIVEDRQIFVNSFWVPQFVINDKQRNDKQVKRVTDFSISMKKSFFVSEQIFFCNHEYIKNAVSLLPKKSDVIYKQAVVMGFLHTDIESSSTGMPIYSKLIDRGETFQY